MLLQCDKLPRQIIGSMCKENNLLPSCTSYQKTIIYLGKWQKHKKGYAKEKQGVLSIHIFV